MNHLWQLRSLILFWIERNDSSPRYTIFRVPLTRYEQHEHERCANIMTGSVNEQERNTTYTRSVDDNKQPDIKKHTVAAE